MFVDKNNKPLRSPYVVQREYEEAETEFWAAVQAEEPREVQLAAFLKLRRASKEYRTLMTPEEWRWVEMEG